MCQLPSFHFQVEIFYKKEKNTRDFSHGMNFRHTILEQ